MGGSSKKKKKNREGKDREQEAVMQSEYGMRRHAVDGEISFRDKLIHGAEWERDFICPSSASSSQFAIGDLLTAECIRNVTGMRGWRE